MELPSEQPRIKIFPWPGPGLWNDTSTIYDLEDVVFPNVVEALEVRSGDQTLIIDAGSGIRELGNFMMAHDLPKGHIDTDIFLSHTHWDHIMGFPFFTPGYLPTTKLRIHGPVTLEGGSLEQVMAGQMTYRYFPIREVELAADITYIELKEDRIDLGNGLILTTKYLNHPIVGDPAYGRKDSRLPDVTLMLHAYSLTIKLPGEDTPRTFRAPLPSRFKKTLQTLNDLQTPD